MNQTPQSQDELLDRTLHEAGSIGKTWARYGLVAGKNALETSAVTLKKVAGLLGDLSAQFKDEPMQEDVVVAEGETVSSDTETEDAPSDSDASQH